MKIAVLRVVIKFTTPPLPTRIPTSLPLYPHAYLHLSPFTHTLTFISPPSITCTSLKCLIDPPLPIGCSHPFITNTFYSSFIP